MFGSRQATRPNIESPYATALTRTGKVDMLNRKPFRTKAQKNDARASAVKEKDGVFRSSAPVSFHSAGRRREA